MALKRGNKVNKAEAPVEEVVEEVSAIEVPDEEEETPSSIAANHRPDKAKAEEAPGKAVALSPGKTDMATTSGQIGEVLAESGFEGLNFGFGSFPMLSLQTDGTFQTSEGDELGKEVNVVLQQSVQKWIYKQDSTDDCEFFYTMNKETNLNGDPIESILAEWAEDGYTRPIIKPYLDVMVKSVEPESYGDMMIMSVPKTSINRFSGHCASGVMQYNRNPDQYVTTVMCGKKVTSTKHSFYPWAFKVNEEMTDEEFPDLS